RSLRKRHLIDSYKRGDRTGAFWGIRTNFADYKLATDPLKCLARNPVPLAEVPTRLEKMPRGLQDRLINWGYAICDAALRAHVNAALQAKLGIESSRPTSFRSPENTDGASIRPAQMLGGDRLKARWMLREDWRGRWSDHRSLCVNQQTQPMTRRPSGSARRGPILRCLTYSRQPRFLPRLNVR